MVVVVVIIGLIAAIAVPRMSRGVQSSGENALAADMALWRQAIDMYASEHGGTFPTQSAIVAQLTTYSNSAGATSTTHNVSNGYVYGPYMRTIPNLPVGSSSLKGTNAVGVAGSTTAAWLYDGNGGITPNTGTLTDSRGVLYSAY